MKLSYRKREHSAWRKSIAAVCLLFLFQASIFAGQPDTLVVPSKTMGKSFKAFIVLPDEYNKTDASFPVLYLLHGWSGSYRDWPNKMDLGPLADRYGFIIICPDGGYAGWYLDSPLVPDSQYESYISKEVPAFVDDNYRTVAEMRGRFICGLSMGGHGAISLIAKYPDRYAAAGSMSGVMALTASSKRFGIAQLIGDIESEPEIWEENSCLRLVEKLVGQKKGIIVDCGVDDFTIKSNRAMHQRLIGLGIDHDYYERPGHHSWDYWINALEYHLLYFSRLYHVQEPGGPAER